MGKFNLSSALSGAKSGGSMGSMFGPIGTVVGALGGGAMGGFGGKEEGGQTITAEQMMPEWQKALGPKLSDMVAKALEKYNPGEAYTGKRTAGMSTAETTGTSLLNKLLGGGGFGSTYDAGKQQILDTLGGKFADPNSSPYIKSMINLSKLNLQDAINQARGQRGARGNYFSTAGLKEEGNIQNRVLANLDSIIGQFTQQERQNMLNAGSTAAQLGQSETMLPIQAAFQYGSLPRTIEQSDLEAKYNDYLRQRTEMSNAVQTGTNLYGSNGQYGIKSMTSPVTESNPMLSILNMINGFKGGAGGANGLGNIMSMFQGAGAG